MNNNSPMKQAVMGSVPSSLKRKITEVCMEKVWLIETGAYSDYRVVGVFSSRKSAEVVFNAIGRDGCINEWIVDPAIKHLNSGRWIYNVTMLRNGDVESVFRENVPLYNLEDGCYIWDRPNAPAYKGSGVPSALQCTVWAKHEKHAIKIANEKRTQMIASGEWKEDGK